jgi:hypothetical protein
MPVIISVSTMFVFLILVAVAVLYFTRPDLIFPQRYITHQQYQYDNL